MPERSLQQLLFKTVSSFLLVLNKMCLQKLLSLIFLSLCVGGFVFQLYQVSDLYFKFLTSSKAEFQVQEMEKYQTIYFCPRYSDLLNRSRNLEHGLLPQKPKNTEEYLHELSVLTIKQIMDLTPSLDNLIATCMIRDQFSRFNFYDAVGCKHIFKISKFVNGERVCYSLSPNVTTRYSVGDAASSGIHTRIAYQLKILQNLADTIYLVFISEYSHSKQIDGPLNSRIFASAEYNANTLKLSNFFVSGASFKIRRLPAPYDTQCKPGHDRQRCYENCLRHSFQQINRVTESGFHKDSLQYKMFNSLDHRNSSLWNLALKWYRNCQGSCKLSIECRTSFSITAVRVFDSFGGAHFALSSMIPNSPHTSLYAVPFLTLVEYIVQVGSCIGVWFGLSVLSFNPTKFNVMALFTHRSKRRVRMKIQQ